MLEIILIILSHAFNQFLKIFFYYNLNTLCASSGVTNRLSYNLLSMWVNEKQIEWKKIMAIQQITNKFGRSKLSQLEPIAESSRYHDEGLAFSEFSPFIGFFRISPNTSDFTVTLMSPSPRILVLPENTSIYFFVEQLSIWLVSKDKYNRFLFCFQLICIDP